MENFREKIQNLVSNLPFSKSTFITNRILGVGLVSMLTSLLKDNKIDYNIFSCGQISDHDFMLIQNLLNVKNRIIILDDIDRLPLSYMDDIYKCITSANNIIAMSTLSEKELNIKDYSLINVINLI